MSFRAFFSKDSNSEQVMSRKAILATTLAQHAGESAIVGHIKSHDKTVAEAGVEPARGLLPNGF